MKQDSNTASNTEAEQSKPQIDETEQPQDTQTAQPQAVTEAEQEQSKPQTDEAGQPQDGHEQTDVAENIVAEKSTQPQERQKGSFDFGAAMAKFGKGAWSYIKYAKIELIVLAAVLAVDLITKAIVNGCMQLNQSIPVIPDFLYFTYVHNDAAAFGKAFGLEKILSPLAVRIILLIITFVAMAVFAYILYRCRKRHFLMRISLAMILGGALGNFIDRLCLGYVRDFVEIVFFGCDLPLFGTSFAIFNIADAGLTVGVILFLIYFIVFFKDTSPQDKSGKTQTEKSTAAVTPTEASKTQNPTDSGEQAQNPSGSGDNNSGEQNTTDTDEQNPTDTGEQSDGEGENGR